MTVSSMPSQDPRRVADETGLSAQEKDAPGGRAADGPAYDLVVAGSGGAGLAAAIAGADASLTVLLLEGAPTWGGSTAMSGGGLWLPNNPLMQRAGAGDSREESLDYIERTVGDVGRATSRARKEAFVDELGPMIELLERHGAKFARSVDYPDYYPELPGGKIGRALEVEPYDTRPLGDLMATLNPGGVPIPAMTNDFWLLARGSSTPDGFLRSARVVARTALGAATGKKLATMGRGLAATLMKIARDLGVELWLEAPVDELTTDDSGRVTGVRTRHNGQPLDVIARRGVVLGSGGFDHNTEMREEYQGVTGKDSSGSPHNMGTAHRAAQRAGAALELMDDAWWGGSIPAPDEAGVASFLVSERAMPYSIIVDSRGSRFANEAESYVDLGHHMRDHATQVPGRFWMVSDVRHARRYLRSYAMDPRLVKKFREAGMWHSAGSLAEIGRLIGADAGTFRATIERFNGMARTGIDHDFARGSSAYDRYYGDPLCRPNPNMGTLEKGPFMAVEIVAGDLGTKGGVLTDEHARALRQDGSVIEGLYAAGNASASVMGHTYPGPGSTIGPATVFGAIAAKHAAGRPAQ